MLDVRQRQGIFDIANIDPKRRRREVSGTECRERRGFMEFSLSPLSKSCQSGGRSSRSTAGQMDFMNLGDGGKCVYNKSVVPGGNLGAYFKTSVDDGAKNHALENNSAPLRDGKKLTRDDLSKKPLAAFSHGAARRGMFGVFHLWWA